MIRFGRDSELGQLVSHRFTAIPGPTVHNPTALFISITEVKQTRTLILMSEGKSSLQDSDVQQDL